MNILLALFFLSFIAGPFTGIPVTSGVYIYPHDVLSGVLACVWIATQIRSGKRPKGILIPPIAVFTVIALLSLSFNIGALPVKEVLNGALYLVRWLLYACVYMAVRNTDVKPDTWIYGLFVSGATFAGLGILQFFLYPQLANLVYLGWDPHFYRLFSTFLDPNYASLLIVLTLILGSVYWDKWPKWAVLAGNMFLIISLVLTYSRSGYISFFVAVLTYVVITKRFVLLAVTGIFMLLFALIPKSPLDVTDMFRKTSSVARITNWQSSWNLAMESPVFGFGFNTIRWIHLKNAPETEKIVPSRAGAGIDSSFIFLAATTGFTGLAAYSWLIISMIRLSFRATHSKKGRTVGFAFLCAIAAVLVHSNFNNSLFYSWILVWMWIAIGALERYF